MAGRVRNPLNRDGRYLARLVMPKELRPFMAGKTELRAGFRVAAVAEDARTGRDDANRHIVRVQFDNRPASEFAPRSAPGLQRMLPALIVSPIRNLSQEANQLHFAQASLLTGIPY